jgi:hypothetical protein
MNKTTPIVLILFLLNFFACKKENTITSDATITYGGYEPTDGCGWLINIDNAQYKSENLPDTYKTDGLKVNIKYTVLDSKYAACWSNFYLIDIHKIHKK